MKKMILILAIVLTLPTSGQTKEDTLTIKKAITDYVEGWATGNVMCISSWSPVFKLLAHN